MHTKLDFLSLGELTENDRELWSQFQSTDPALASPYFSHAFALAVDSVRPGVRLLRAEQDSRPVAYWPVRRGLSGTARPIAGPMDDLHGIIADPSITLSLPPDQLRLHIGGYAFTALPFSQRRHGLHGQIGDGNQVIDLSEGYDAWLAARSEASSNFRREHRKVCALLDRADVQIHHDLADHSSLDRLIHLKRDAYARAGHFDLFSLEWPRALLETLLASEQDTARGVLSTLSIGGETAAICYNLRSQTCLHYWFPAYETQHARAKPGLALLFSLTHWAAQEGLTELHLGRGDDQYKRHLASWMAPVRGGTLALAAPHKLATRLTDLSYRIEGRHGLMDLPAKLCRKLDRVAQSGSWRA